MKFITQSVEETFNLGKKIGTLVCPGDIICLIGNLGTGKTHFTKGIGCGLGIDDCITSPTFTIVNEYDGRLKLYHFDVYRVNDPDEINYIGFDEYLFSDGVSVIEWADYIDELIPSEKITVGILKMPKLGENYREINISYNGNRYDYLKEITL